MDDKRLVDIVNISLGHVLEAHRQSEARVMVRTLKRYSNVCESPIEKYFCLSYAAAMTVRGLARSIGGQVVLHPLLSGYDELDAALTPDFYSDIVGNGFPSDELNLIYPQYRLGEYRADFVIARTSCGIDDLWAPVLYVCGPLVIECDGFDYHDRTKDQAARDKQRDRAMLSLGLPVLRFAGTELYKDPMKCAVEASEFLDKNRRAVPYVLAHAKQEGARF